VGDTWSARLLTPHEGLNVASSGGAPGRATGACGSTNASIVKVRGVGTIVNDDAGVATACSPRPPVAVSSVPTGDGRLAMTLTAGTQGPNGANRLTELRFGAGANTLVDVAGQTGKSGAFTVPLNGSVVSVTFVVRRATPGQATTVPVTIVDTCGDWPSFVGGGPGAF